MSDEREFIVTQTETFRIRATSAEEAEAKLAEMDTEEQNKHYEETTEREAVEV